MTQTANATTPPAKPAGQSAELHVWAPHQTEGVLFKLERRDRRMGGAFGASVVSHIVVVVLFIVIARALPEQTFTPLLPDLTNYEIVWLPAPGPGGGGGGGGNRSPEPPRKVELPGREKVTVPAAKPAEPAPRPEDEPKPVENLTIPAKTLASADQALPGVFEGLPPAVTTSQGSGTGGGAGTGTGTGIGPGSGSGLGPGTGGGTGGGAYRPGNGVELPRLLREVKPQYTADAMRAKIQGTVMLEAIVMPDGTVGSVEVVRSLDGVFGLDQEAIKAARQWRFVPGTRFGQPVPVIVTIELTFTLR
jgi:TonB family protein